MPYKSPNKPEMRSRYSQTWDQPHMGAETSSKMGKVIAKVWLPKMSPLFLPEACVQRGQGIGALRRMNTALGHLRKLHLAFSALNYILRMYLFLNLKNFQGYYWQYMNLALKYWRLPWSTLDLNLTFGPHFNLPGFAEVKWMPRVINWK